MMIPKCWMNQGLHHLAIKEVQADMDVMQHYHMCSNYSRTKLLRLEDFIKIHGFNLADACSPQVYITYIHYICSIIYVCIY